MSYNYIDYSVNNGVGLLRLNRPDKLNAICFAMMHEILATLRQDDANDAVGCFVITGSDKAFAAGADIEEMAKASEADMLRDNPFSVWDDLRTIQKPIIAAVSGYALGGGCELAMLCDLIIASDSAIFSQPEVTIGIIPGAGGTQRLVRAVGKAKAMEMTLSGDVRLAASEALQAGLVASVHSVESYLDEALSLAAKIASRPRTAVQQSKAMINAALEQPLTAGIALERETFYRLFDSHDKTEGMAAFLAKRKPVFEHQLG